MKILIVLIALLPLILASRYTQWQCFNYINIYVSDTSKLRKLIDDVATHIMEINGKADKLVEELHEEIQRVNITYGEGIAALFEQTYEARKIELAEEPILNAKCLSHIANRLGQHKIHQKSISDYVTRITPGWSNVFKNLYSKFADTRWALANIENDFFACMEKHGEKTVTRLPQCSRVILNKTRKTQPGMVPELNKVFDTLSDKQKSLLEELYQLLKNQNIPSFYGMEESVKCLT